VAETRDHRFGAFGLLVVVSVVTFLVPVRPVSASVVASAKKISGSSKAGRAVKAAPKTTIRPKKRSPKPNVPVTNATGTTPSTTLPREVAPTTNLPGIGGSTVPTIVPHLPTGPGVAAPPEAAVILPPLSPATPVSSGSAVAHRDISPFGALPADLTPQEYVQVVLGWTEEFSVRRKAVDLPALRARVEAVTAGATTTAETYPALEAYLALLGDGHSALYTPNEARSLLEGKARGFGFTLIDGYMFPFPGSPAEAAGLRDRDRLVGVNGMPYVKGTRLSGIPDSSTFDVVRVDPTTSTEATLSFTVDRGDITTSLKPKIRRLTSVSGDDTRLGLVDLPGATGSKADETAFVAAGLEGLRDTDTVPRCGWVLDLRRNSGGFGPTMIAGVAPLYGDGVFAGLLDARERVSWLSIKGASVLVDGQLQVAGSTTVKLAIPNAPIAVLTGPVTASAAELALVGLTGRGGVRVFGEPSVGVTSGNLGRVLPDGSFVAVTNVYDVDRVGHVYDGPLQPDEVVTMDWSRFGLATDPVLASATTWLKHQSACNGSGS
jgi:carboxyl-terminal processing protease